MVRVFIFFLFLASAPVFCDFAQEVEDVRSVALNALGNTGLIGPVDSVDVDSGFDEDGDEL